MALPLYCFVRGDTLGVVVLAPEDETVNDLGQRLARAASPRVAMARNLSVWHRGKPLAPELTLRAAGVAALDRVDLIAEEELG